MLPLLDTNGEVIDFYGFLKKGLLSLQSYDDFGNQYFDFVKLLLLFSIYLLGYLETIMMLHELSDGYARLLQGYSPNRKMYLWYRMLLTLRYFIWDVVVWLSGFATVAWYGIRLDFFWLLCLFLWQMLLYLNLSIWVTHPLQALLLVFLAFFSLPLLLSDAMVMVLVLLLVTFVLGWTKVGVMLRKDE